jgi:hypothetical protein
MDNRLLQHCNNKNYEWVEQYFNSLVSVQKYHLAVLKLIMKNKDKVLLEIVLRHIGHLLLMWVIEDKLIDELAYLFANSMTMINYKEDYLLRVCESGSIEVLKLFLRYGTNIHQNHDLPLRNAVRSNRYEVAKLLIENGADIHCDDDEPFRTAVRNSFFEIAHLLLDYGADVSQVNWHYYDRSQHGFDPYIYEQEKALLFRALDAGADYRCRCSYNLDGAQCIPSSSFSEYIFRKLVIGCSVSDSLLFEEFSCDRLYDSRIWRKIREY